MNVCRGLGFVSYPWALEFALAGGCGSSVVLVVLAVVLQCLGSEGT